jgi:ATP-dependent HslUV protease ATP-binding subunit HslU
MILDGSLDDTEIEVEVPANDKPNTFSIDTSGGGNPDAEKKWGEIFSLLGRRPSLEKKKMTLAEGREIVYQMELDRLLEKVDLKKEAIHAVQESGIVFIDEIDKICTSRDASQWKSDASAEGVQRDLLPLVEGTTINTKHGNVNTDYILFIASGAFHSVKPSDMLPELQGRLPIRVELQALSENDLYKILTEPVANVSRSLCKVIFPSLLRCVDSLCFPSCCFVFCCCCCS